MADYKNIKGFNIQYLDSDPPNPIEGQMWFNSTTQTLKGAEAGGAPIGTWASGGNVNTGGVNVFGVGTSTSSALIYGGESGRTNQTEKYDGTSWTELNNLNASGQNGGSAGNAEDAAAMSGDASGPRSVSTEFWDGTNWTEGAELNVARQARNWSRYSNISYVIFWWLHLSKSWS
jgi:hypothetical protein